VSSFVSSDVQTTVIPGPSIANEVAATWDVKLFLAGDATVQSEMFGPATVLVEVAHRGGLLAMLHSLHGQFTASLICDPERLRDAAEIVARLEQKVGRVLVSGYLTGVEVSAAIVHGGPYPATSDARGTSVGGLSIERWLSPICYQNVPDQLLPAALKNANPLGIVRLINGRSSGEGLT
jgi:NADP-dependent aldehyde dehydrogenase